MRCHKHPLLLGKCVSATNLSQILKTTSVYQGETFTLSATIVKYEFGTTQGRIQWGA